MADNKKKETPKKVPPAKKDNNKRFKSFTFLIILTLVSVYLFRMTSDINPQPKSIPYSQYSKILQNDSIVITKARILKVENGNQFHGIVSKEILAGNGSLMTLNELEKILGIKIPLDKDFQFVTYLPQISQGMMQQWEDRNIPFEFVSEKTNWYAAIFSMLPIILMVLFFILVFRQMQSGGPTGGGRGLFSFGKSRAKQMPMDLPKTTFEDVAGADEAKIELEEIIDFLKDPQKFQVLGGRIPKGVLLLGSPGTGKTLLARAVAGEAGVPFFSISGSDFVEMFVGVGASRVRDLFEQGKKSAPCIIFIDEIDAVGRHRGAGLGGGHDEREQTLNQLLVEMDGFEANAGVILIAATNRPDVLDPALLRPGRFDRQVVVDRPDMRGRHGILKVHTRKVPLGKDVDLEIIARGTPGLSGADLANIVNEAALLAARYGQKEVTMLDFEEAKDKVLMGTERRSMLIAEKEKLVIAYHEAGHALMGKLLPEANPVHKVTIIPRGMALGVTFHLPQQDKHINTKAYYLSELCVIYGGRVAEEIRFNEISTGASNDIEKATQIGRMMVCNWGMSEKIGPISFGRKEEHIFLGREISQHRDFSEETSRAIDAEIRQILESQLTKTRKMLAENKDKLDMLALAVLEHEYLDAEEIDKILNGEKLSVVKKPRVMVSRRKKDEPKKDEPAADKKDEDDKGQVLDKTA